MTIYHRHLELGGTQFYVLPKHESGHHIAAEWHDQALGTRHPDLPRSSDTRPEPAVLLQVPPQTENRGEHDAEVQPRPSGVDRSITGVEPAVKTPR